MPFTRRNERKMKKVGRWLFILLAAVMAAGVSGCGTDDAASAENTEHLVAAEHTVEDQETEEQIIEEEMTAPV